jgi:hypothetical protein
MKAKGHSHERIKAAWRIAWDADPVNLQPIDDYLRETYSSITHRGVQDALNGKPPNPIWGDFDL